MSTIPTGRKPRPAGMDKAAPSTDGRTVIALPVGGGKKVRDAQMGTALGGGHWGFLQNFIRRHRSSAGCGVPSARPCVLRVCVSSGKWRGGVLECSHRRQHGRRWAAHPAPGQRDSSGTCRGREETRVQHCGDKGERGLYFGSTLYSGSAISHRGAYSIRELDARATGSRGKPVWLANRPDARRIRSCDRRHVDGDAHPLRWRHGLPPFSSLWKHGSATDANARASCAIGAPGLAVRRPCQRPVGAFALPF